MRQVGSQFLFASEIKSLLAHPAVPRRLSACAVQEYLETRFVEAPGTIVEGIWKLPPATVAIVDGSGVALRSYWALSQQSSDGMDGEEVFRRYQDVFRDAVQAWMVADVPVGAFLSGGVDSSTLVATMARISSRKVQTFTAGFGWGAEVNETAHARRVAEHVGTEHHELHVMPEDPEELRRVMYHLEEPLGDPAVVPTYVLSRLAHSFVKVVLSGEGSDEVNLGYERYLDPWRVNRMARLPRVWRDLLRRWGLRSTAPYSLRQAASLLELDAPHRWLRLRGVGPGLPGPFEPAFEALVNETRPPEADSRYATAEALKPPAEWDLDRLYFELGRADMQTWLANDLLVKVDKMTMAFGLEARTPYLDHLFVEFVSGLPVRHRLRFRQTKALLRRHARSLLPLDIANRQQHGFIMPVSQLYPGLDRFIRATLERHGREMAVLFPSQTVLEILDSPGMAKIRWMLFTLFLVTEELRLEFPL